MSGPVLAIHRRGSVWVRSVGRPVWDYAVGCSVWAGSVAAAGGSAGQAGEGLARLIGLCARCACRVAGKQRRRHEHEAEGQRKPENTREADRKVLDAHHDGTLREPKVLGANLCHFGHRCLADTRCRSGQPDTRRARRKIRDWRCPMQSRRQLRESGIVADEDLSPQKARILLMLMLLTATDIATVQQAYQTY